ncbi:Hypothetical predicted protein [Paramuricea clavata]|uniref:Uncharacterized protein n=1 Tax=Paramuricea clavata TaxID=317549 RepID=A0A6S7JQK0_PARCT|nr:Hypothetical predicted protein [Paramuricea clavata]
MVGPTQPAPTFQGPKLERPKIDVGVSIEDWNVFVRRWEVFRTGSGINDTSVSYQLFQCAGTDLGDSLLKANSNAASGTLKELLTAMCSLAVIPVATCVSRTELLQLRQERDEAFRTFTARVRGKAETFAFTAECECGKGVDYTDNVIRDDLLNHLSDPDIRREILGTPDILKKPVNDVIALVENEEMARNALPSSTLSAVLSFQRQKNPTTTTATSPSQVDQTKEGTCPDCKHTFKVGHYHAWRGHLSRCTSTRPPLQRLAIHQPTYPYTGSSKCMTSSLETTPLVSLSVCLMANP